MCVLLQIVMITGVLGHCSVTDQEPMVEANLKSARVSCLFLAYTMPDVPATCTVFLRDGPA